MIKADIVNRVAQASDVSRVKAAIAVDTVLDAMKEALRQGKRIELRGFGVFQVRDRKRGIGRNPKTGVEVEVLLRRGLDAEGRLGLPRLRRAMAKVQFEFSSDGPALEALLRQLDFHVSKLMLLCAATSVDEVWATYGLADLASRLGRLIERGEVNLASVVLVDSYLRRALPAQQVDASS